MSYGMGLYVGGPFGSEPAVFHPGGEPDFAAMMVILPEQRSGLVLLMNVSPEAPLPGAAGAIKRIGAGAASILMGSTPPTGRSMRTYYLAFDFLVLGTLLASTWALARAVRRRPPALPRLSRVLRASGAGLALVFGALLLVGPLLVEGGWKELFLWVPDLALVLVVLGALLVAIGAVSLVNLARQRWADRDNAPPSQEVSGDVGVRSAPVPIGR